MSDRVTSLREAAKRRRRQSFIQDFAVGCVVAVLACAAVLLLVCVAGVFTLVAWNVGVIGIAAAVGLAVSKISLWTAIGANLAVAVIGRVFNRTPSGVTLGNNSNKA